MFIDFVINKPCTATLHPGTSDLPSNHITNQCDEANKNTVNSLKSGKMEQEEHLDKTPTIKLKAEHLPLASGHKTKQPSWLHCPVAERPQTAYSTVSDMICSPHKGSTSPSSYCSTSPLAAWVSSETTLAPGKFGCFSLATLHGTVLNLVWNLLLMNPAKKLLEKPTP